MKTTPTSLMTILFALMAFCTTANAQTLVAGFETDVQGFDAPDGGTLTIGPAGATEGTSALQYTTTTSGFKQIRSFSFFGPLTDPTNATISFDVLYTPDFPEFVSFSQVDFGINSNGTVIDGTANWFQFTSETGVNSPASVVPGEITHVEFNFSDLQEFPLTAPGLNYAGLMFLVNSDGGAGGTWSFDNVIISSGATVLLGDVNLDETVDVSDISPFIAVLSNGGDQAEADCNEDGTIDFSDISAFIAILWTAAWLTPPAPITSVFPMTSVSRVCSLIRSRCSR